MWWRYVFPPKKDMVAKKTKCGQIRQNKSELISPKLIISWSVIELQSWLSNSASKKGVRLSSCRRCIGFARSVNLDNETGAASAGTQTIKLYGDFFVAQRVQAKRPESVKSGCHGRGAGGKKFTLSDANRQRFRQEQADGKIKACVPLLGCSPAGNQEYKICLESCETGGRGSNLGEK